MSSHCLVDWNISDFSIKEGVVEHMAQCMIGNRDWTKEHEPIEERRWQPPAFAIISPADNLIFYLACLLDANNGKVTESKFEEWLGQNKFEKEEWRDNLRIISKLVLKELNVLEVDARTTSE